MYNSGGAPNCIVNRMTSDAPSLFFLACIFLTADHLSDLPGQLRAIGMTQGPKVRGKGAGVTEMGRRVQTDNLLLNILCFHKRT